MKNTKYSFTSNLNPQPHSGPQVTPGPQESKWGPKPALPPGIRTTARDYANPVDYKHPYPSMAQFADLLALHYDANRTRHSYYRQLRLIHQHFACDPSTHHRGPTARIFPFRQTQEALEAQNHPPGTGLGQNVLCRSARQTGLDALFPNPRQRSRHPSGGAHPPTGPGAAGPYPPAPLPHSPQTHLLLRTAFKRMPRPDHSRHPWQGKQTAHPPRQR